MAARVPAANVRLKRAYERATRTDGERVLIDRLWPRGVTKADAAIRMWAKALAPSMTLRKWFGHDAARWPEFRRRYAHELRQHPAELSQLSRLARARTVTLIYSARDEEHNNAVVLRDLIVGRPVGRTR